MTITKEEKKSEDNNEEAEQKLQMKNGTSQKSIKSESMK